jgi:hypothetical protein
MVGVKLFYLDLYHPTSCQLATEIINNRKGNYGKIKKYIHRIYFGLPVVVLANEPL